MLSVRGSRECRAASLALSQAERSIRLDINKDARGRISPLWKGELTARARTRMQQRVIVAGARATANERGVTLYAATSSRPLAGGLVPSSEWAGNEFGAVARRPIVQLRSRRGRTFSRRQWINRQFMTRRKDGMVAFDAASEVGTRLVAIWVRTIVEDLAKVPGAEVIA